ncbi:DUF5786 family protein [Halorussus halobius]|uniref:DUF5786 family protein n=1 Tax=Halorussus halobius TaxID=1710537 RepID=UPI0010929A4E|nr:DUF5786 family protein [Halorussus halobius]
MGFGSYDESEQDNQEYDADIDDDSSVSAEENSHEGTVDFEIGASNDELLDRLQDIKADGPEET